MGSEVVDGFCCKPKDFKPNKPMMHYKTHVFVCNGQRCKDAYPENDKIEILRELLKTLELNRGTKRIKLSRAGCFGACRFRSVITIYENSRANGYLPNDNIWLKECHKLSIDEWRELFLNLSQNKKLKDNKFHFTIL